MKFKIELAHNFKKEAKRLSKKYPSLKIELSVLFDELEKDPFLGTLLGNNVYKIRLGIVSKGKGKSGGARIIYYVKNSNQTILLLSIYNKGEKEAISEREIKELMEIYG